jgi:hypothetical protein
LLEDIADSLLNLKSGIRCRALSIDLVQIKIIVKRMRLINLTIDINYILSFAHKN